MIIHETPDEGGLARFDLSVVETEEGKVGLIQLTEPDVDIKAGLAATKATTSFEDKFSLIGAIQEVRAAAVSVIQTATQKMRAARAVANAAISLVDDTKAAIDRLEETAETLITTAGTLAQTVLDVSGDIFGGLAELDKETADLIGAGQKEIEALDGSVLFADYRAAKSLEAFTALTSNGDDLPDVVTEDDSSQSVLERDNQDALVELFQLSAAIEGARAFALFKFNSRDLALSTRDAIAEELDSLADTASDELYGALIDLRASISTHLSQVAASLPDIIEYTPNATYPALAMVYDIYGDLSLEADFIIRNAVVDPTSIPGLVTLKLVSNE